MPALADASNPVPVEQVTEGTLEQLKADMKRKDKTESYAMSLMKLGRPKITDAMMSNQLPKLEKAMEEMDLVACQCLNCVGPRGPGFASFQG